MGTQHLVTHRPSVVLALELLSLVISSGSLVACLANSSPSASPTPSSDSSPRQGSSAGQSDDAKGFWPEGIHAAVSLTYDDALASQRTNATSSLARHELLATFFLTGKSEDLKANRDQWQAVAAKGHELGAHTIKHPCDRSFDWVPKGDALQDYDLERMKSELQENKLLLGGLGAQPPYSFAYPCGATTVGEEPKSYGGLVAKDFIAARGVQSQLAAPALVDLNLVPAVDGAKTQEQLLALVDRAEAEGAWLVLYFHGVGGDYLSVELGAHEALLQALESRSDRVWTAPFGKVAAYVGGKRKP